MTIALLLASAVLFFVGALAFFVGALAGNRTAGRGRHVTSPGGGGPDGGVEAVTKNVTPSDPRPPLEWLSIKRELLMRAALDGETIDDAIEARAELLALEIVERGARSLHVRSDA